VSPLVTPAIARAVLWFYGYPPREDPGNFMGCLLGAIANADRENLELLRSGFPGPVEAVLAGREQTYGIDRLKKIAGVS
jgi:hypothetical protein